VPPFFLRDGGTTNNQVHEAMGDLFREKVSAKPGRRSRKPQGAGISKIYDSIYPSYNRPPVRFSDLGLADWNRRYPVKKPYWAVDKNGVYGIIVNKTPATGMVTLWLGYSDDGQPLFYTLHYTDLRHVVNERSEAEELSNAIQNIGKKSFAAAAAPAAAAVAGEAAGATAAGTAAGSAAGGAGAAGVLSRLAPLAANVGARASTAAGKVAGSRTARVGKALLSTISKTVDDIEGKGDSPYKELDTIEQKVKQFAQKLIGTRSGETVAPVPVMTTTPPRYKSSQSDEDDDVIQRGKPYSKREIDEILRRMTGYDPKAKKREEQERLQKMIEALFGKKRTPEADNRYDLRGIGPRGYRTSPVGPRYVPSRPTYENLNYRTLKKLSKEGSEIWVLNKTSKMPVRFFSYVPRPERMIGFILNGRKSYEPIENFYDAVFTDERSAWEEARRIWGGGENLRRSSSEFKGGLGEKMSQIDLLRFRDAFGAGKVDAIAYANYVLRQEASNPNISVEEKFKRAASRADNILSRNGFSGLKTDGGDIFVYRQDDPSRKVFLMKLEELSLPDIRRMAYKVPDPKGKAHPLPEVDGVDMNRDRETPPNLEVNRPGFEDGGGKIVGHSKVDFPKDREQAQPLGNRAELMEFIKRIREKHHTKIVQPSA